MRISSIEQAIKVLKAGGVVVYPTDTAYGLAVDATNLAAVKKLYTLKGRDFKKPTHVIVPSTDLLTVPYYSLNRAVLKLINKFWPGPLTIIVPLKARGASWKMLSAGTKTIGIRYPNHPPAQILCEALGKPITTTSANVSGQSTTYSVSEVKKQFAKYKLKPDFYLDGGKLKRVAPSTIVAIVNNRVKILREGPISEKEIKKAL
ncbi:MAG: threonylcarbamoyl-AMP synthase [Candidatus Doudnabacteria bacterium]|nr:threonylcarbamoyl-AMP synthase [Candidatus Doudnabacteria bacterium]